MVTDFDFKSTFEAAGKESTEWSDQRCERRECNTMDLKWVEVDGFLRTNKHTDIISKPTHEQKNESSLQIIKKRSFASRLKTRQYYSEL